MKNPFTRLFRARDKPGATDSVSSAPTFYFGSSAAGKSVTASTAIQMSTVYACVRVIAETIASLPLHVYQNQGEGSVKALDHPLYPILHDEPNSEMTSFVWRETMLAHLLLWGNAYCQIIRSGRSQILGLYPLLPDRMEVDRDSAGALTYTYSANSGQTVKLRPEDVLHIPGLGFDGIMGYSPIALEKNAIGLGLAAEEYGSKFFSNGARPSGILTHPNTVKDPKKLRTAGTPLTAARTIPDAWLCWKRACPIHPSPCQTRKHSFWKRASFRYRRSAVFIVCRRIWWAIWNTLRFRISSISPFRLPYTPFAPGSFGWSRP